MIFALPMLVDCSWIAHEIFLKFVMIAVLTISRISIMFLKKFWGQILPIIENLKEILFMMNKKDSNRISIYK
jgi:hypothetical protein